MANINKEYDLLFRLVLIGDYNVGKTDLFSRFTNGTFNSTFKYKCVDFMQNKTVELGIRKIKLHIWDTAGLERFHTIIPSYYRGAMGVMVVYDIINQESFENISKWLRNIDEYANEDVEKNDFRIQM